MLAMAQSQAPVCDLPDAVDIPMDVRYSRDEHNKKISAILSGVPKTAYDDALALYGKRTPEARKILDRILLENPNHGPALLLRARIAASAAFRDVDRLKADVAKFHQACPMSYAAASEFSNLPDVEWIAREAALLRQQLHGRAGSREAQAYPVLWQWERTSRQSKAPWAKDLEWLRDESFPRSESWLNALRNMEFLEEVRLDWIGADYGRFYPHSSAALQPQLEALRVQGNKPEVLARFAELAKQYPASTSVASYWIGLVRQQDHLVVDAYLAMKTAMALDPASYRTLPPHQINMAQDLVSRKLRMDLVPSFVFAGIEAIERETARESVSDLYPGAEKGRQRQHDYWYLEAYFPLIQAYAAMGKLSEGLDVVSQAQLILNRSRPPAEASLEDRNRHLRMEANFWRVKGILAEARGKPFDALIAYRNAMASYPPRSSRGDERDDVMARARALVKQFGGSEEAWMDWEAKQPLESFRAGVGGSNAWKSLAAKQPGLKIKDMLGREFTPEQLATKKTFVNLWATWCLPCRAELPYLEQLSQKLKGQEDVAVIALNVDEDGGLVEPFLKRFQFGFGNNLAQGYAYSILPVMAIPANYVVTATKTEAFWSEQAAEAWVEHALNTVKLTQ